jgi:hypothetical protein
MRSHGDSVLESGRATAVQPSGASALLFSRQEAHAILRPRSGRIRARCELVGRSQLWPEELTFKRKTGRSESDQKRRFDNRPFTSGLPRKSDVLGVGRQFARVPGAVITPVSRTVGPSGHSHPFAGKSDSVFPH